MSFISISLKMCIRKCKAPMGRFPLKITLIHGIKNPFHKFNSQFRKSNSKFRKFNRFNNQLNLQMTCGDSRLKCQTHGHRTNKCHQLQCNNNKLKEELMNTDSIWTSPNNKQELTGDFYYIFIYTNKCHVY